MQPQHDIEQGVDLDALRAAQALHLDHYGGKRLPYACLSAHGLRQRLVKLEGDSAGSVYEVIDASGGYASACLGAGHGALQKAVAEAMASGEYVTDELGSSRRSQFLLDLFGPKGAWTEHFPYPEYHVSGRNSGSEGMELALRLVLESRFDRRCMAPRQASEKRCVVLVFEGAWHGWTGGLLQLLNRRHYTIGLPVPQEIGSYGIRICSIPFGEVDVLEAFFRKRSDELLAVIMEPIQGDAGILVPSGGYLRLLARLCQRNGVLLVADEVLTFAKTGALFAMRDECGAIPTDITVVGKSIGMGALSTSMVIARRELSVRPCGAVATSDLRPMTCAIMAAGLRILEKESLISRSLALGDELRQMLRQEVAEVYPQLFGEVRGLGFLNGVELTALAAESLGLLRERLLEAGVYVEFMAGAGRRSGGLRYLHPAMRVAPPLIASREELSTVVASIRQGAQKFVEFLR